MRRPSRSRARSVDDRADVYALGCVLYESLSGRRRSRTRERRGTALGPRDGAASEAQRRPPRSARGARCGDREGDGQAAGRPLRDRRRAHRRRTGRRCGDAPLNGIGACRPPVRSDDPGRNPGRGDRGRSAPNRRRHSARGADGSRAAGGAARSNDLDGAAGGAARRLSPGRGNHRRPRCRGCCRGPRHHDALVRLHEDTESFIAAAGVSAPHLPGGAGREPRSEELQGRPAGGRVAVHRSPRRGPARIRAKGRHSSRALRPSTDIRSQPPRPPSRPVSRPAGGSFPSARPAPGSKERSPSPGLAPRSPGRSPCSWARRRRGSSTPLRRCSRLRGPASPSWSRSRCSWSTASDTCGRCPPARRRRPARDASRPDRSRRAKRRCRRPASPARGGFRPGRPGCRSCSWSMRDRTVTRRRIAH